MARAHSLGSAQAVPLGAPQVLAGALRRPGAQALLRAGGGGGGAPPGGGQPPLSAGMHSLLCGPQVPLWQTWAALAGVQAPLPETLPHFLLAPQMLSAQVLASVQSAPTMSPQVLVVALQRPLAQTAV